MSVSLILRGKAEDHGAEAVRSKLLYLAATLSLTAAVIHLWAALEHFEEWWAYGLFFLVTAAAQAIFGVALVRQPGQRLLLAGVGANLAIVALYVVTRTLGVPFVGPHAWHPEEVGVLDLVATASELMLAVALVALLQGSFRAVAGKALLCLGVVGALAAGGWGVVASANSELPPARIGEAVEVSGGLLTIDRVAAEHMAPMQMGNYAKQGMSMSMPQNMDMTPEDKRRFTVEVTLATRQDSSLAYAADQFRVTGEGMGEVGPYQSEMRNGGSTLLKDGTVPADSAVSGTMTFQVPKEARDLMLGFDGSQPVALDLEPATKSDGNSSDGSHH